MTTVETVTTDTLKEIARAFNRHDVEGVMTFFADDAVFDTPKVLDTVGSSIHRTRADPRRSRRPLRRHPRCSLRRRLALGEWRPGASPQWTLTGTTTDGLRLEVRGCDLWTFRDGKVAGKDSYWKIVEA